MSFNIRQLAEAAIAAVQDDPEGCCLKFADVLSLLDAEQELIALGVNAVPMF